MQTKPSVKTSDAVGPEYFFDSLECTWGFHKFDAFAGRNGVFQLPADLVCFSKRIQTQKILR